MPYAEEVLGKVPHSFRICIVNVNSMSEASLHGADVAMSKVLSSLEEAREKDSYK